MGAEVYGEAACGFSLGAPLYPRRRACVIVPDAVVEDVCVG